MAQGGLEGKKGGRKELRSNGMYDYGLNDRLGAVRVGKRTFRSTLGFSSFPPEAPHR